LYTLQAPMPTHKTVMRWCGNSNLVTFMPRENIYQLICHIRKYFRANSSSHLWPRWGCGNTSYKQLFLALFTRQNNSTCFFIKSMLPLMAH